MLEPHTGSANLLANLYKPKQLLSTLYTVLPLYKHIGYMHNLRLYLLDAQSSIFYYIVKH
jgi:hypothetical protein